MNSYSIDTLKGLSAQAQRYIHGERPPYVKFLIRSEEEYIAMMKALTSENPSIEAVACNSYLGTLTCTRQGWAYKVNLTPDVAIYLS